MACGLAGRFQVGGRFLVGYIAYRRQPVRIFCPQWRSAKRTRPSLFLGGWRIGLFGCYLAGEIAVFVFFDGGARLYLRRGGGGGRCQRCRCRRVRQCGRALGGRNHRRSGSQVATLGTRACKPAFVAARQSFRAGLQARVPRGVGFPGQRRDFLRPPVGLARHHRRGRRIHPPQGRLHLLLPQGEGAGALLAFILPPHGGAKPAGGQQDDGGDEGEGEPGGARGHGRGRQICGADRAFLTRKAMDGADEREWIAN